MENILRTEIDNKKVYFRDAKGSRFILGDLGRTLEKELIGKAKGDGEKGFLFYVSEEENENNITISREEYSRLVGYANEKLSLEID
ncbi:MAG: hypothetical protein PHQ66_02720 [Candidatus Nanoarchaeia archaeon]|nr:hypothetical protein [Candidatus Nanoarchaeia archaeon]MDD5357721.1 hypothetical protein [Candidatus Nanoarchaeia archaeon]MDD5588640.1 hypothetical protein [Candidatus Nanoarchaeia archaeon]